MDFDKCRKVEDAYIIAHLVDRNTDVVIEVTGRVAVYEIINL